MFSHVYIIFSGINVINLVSYHMVQSEFTQTNQTNYRTPRNRYAKFLCSNVKLKNCTLYDKYAGRVNKI